MPDAAGPGPPIRFGLFTLDPRSGDLRKGRTRIRVPAQSLRVLSALLERPGEVVGRDELRRRLWTSETFVDFEQGLNAAVRRLREALGDSADSPRFIETLPKRGYRFIGTIEPVDEPARSDPAATADRPAGAGPGPSLTAPTRTTRTPRPWPIAVAIVVVVTAGVAGWWSWQQSVRFRWAHTAAGSEVSRLIDEQDYDAAFRVAEHAAAIDPRSQSVQELRASASRPASITSEPSGADVFVRGYRSTSDWIPLGRTPLEQTRIPGGLLRFRVTREGFDPFEGASHWGRPLHFTLAPAGTAPDGMVWVPPGAAPGVDGTLVTTPGFWMDRLEVTNREFRKFVDAGGYASPDYWREPIASNGRQLAWSEAMRLFIDATGRPGPAGWEVGTYAAGQDEYPVTGVSWYEAAAFMAFAGKSLPTVYHWRRTSGADLLFADIIPLSNFGRKGLSKAGAHAGLGTYGALDMAGNAKEWCWNDTGGRRLILGGAWNDDPHVFGMLEAFPPIERRADYGFRGIREVEPADPALRASVSIPPPGPPRPVGDELYGVYTRFFAHDRPRVDARVDGIDDAPPGWRRETVSFLSSDGLDRVPAVLFLPRRATPPFQVALYVPGADAEMLRSRGDMNMNWVEVILRSGRAVLHPIYRGTFERGLAPNEMGPHTRRDLRIQNAKEIARALDFIEARPDLDRSRVALIGMSNGAVQGVISGALESRFRTLVLLGAGLVDARVPPELNPANYAPRVRTPTLMINGRWDFVLPYETAQRPLFRLLGTSPHDKRHEVFDGGHVPLRRQDAVAVVLDWLDRYLGPVLTPGTSTPTARN
jgi:DNA-binding winged helix-turn-helix (wHTH) protein/predicted esterase